jgi:hypothetical protein
VFVLLNTAAEVVAGFRNPCASSTRVGGPCDGRRLSCSHNTRLGGVLPAAPFRHRAGAHPRSPGGPLLAQVRASRRTQTLWCQRGNPPRQQRDALSRFQTSCSSRAGVRSFSLRLVHGEHVVRVVVASGTPGGLSEMSDDRKLWRSESARRAPRPVPIVECTCAAAPCLAWVGMTSPPKGEIV